MNPSSKDPISMTNKSTGEQSTLVEQEPERELVEAASADSSSAERTPTSEELEALLSAEPKTIASGTAPKLERGGKTRRTKRIIAVLGLVIVVAAVSVWFYVRNQARPVPTPTSTGPMTTSSATEEMPSTAFRISPEKQQLIGVQYGAVEFRPISKSLRAVGRVAFDETKITRINPKIEGWIEDVFVDFTGKLVQKGQPLLTIYSPDLVQTQQEYLLAIKGRKQLGESPFGEAVNFSDSLIESARRRLELWDITDQQIKELEKRGTPSKTMTLYAPAAGFVTTRNAFPKQRVMPDTELYSLADLSNVWVVADIYEFEAADIKLDQTATVTLSSYPGREFKGKITYIYPQVESTTRTLKVRIELANKGFLLKPDMYADVALNMNYGRRLVVPQEAVMDSGSEQLVYVSLKDGYFEPRKVQLGQKVDNKYVVLAGLSDGERVVTSGNFLVDSESRLKSASGGMGMPGMDHGSPQPKQEGGVNHDQMQMPSSERKILFWYDPMHPAYKSDQPGKAPDCGMDLVPKYADEK